MRTNPLTRTHKQAGGWKSRSSTLMNSYMSCHASPRSLSSDTVWLSTNLFAAGGDTCDTHTDFAHFP